ncbi:sulfatase/phosphatase domain-containing protein [Microbulbifer sp. Q7]|uniref:sulfatase/phosphatase domain-containing protein n=1 Tax=Microbulbifer sp. Q7 TaxID=1785091 RepID=UPI00128FE18E|nr:sulfatase/phosphatase domain-containing protein [Microbulbifer sp. Q7]
MCALNGNATPGAEEGQRVQGKPNIIFIMSDDHAYQAVSAYGSELIETPNIDRLAEEGVRFDNASVTNSICAPSRATILTGKHSHLNGKIDNNAPFDDSQTTFPQLLKQAGYATAMFGKLHFGNNPKGVDEFMILPGQGDYINPDFVTPQGTVRKQGYVTDIITDETLHWLEQRDSSKPFFLAYLHKAPHRPWWPRADKFAEFYEKEFPYPETLLSDNRGRGTAAQTAEMSLLRDMRYSHDSKIFPETYAAMESVEPPIPPSSWGFEEPFNRRVTPEQRAAYMPTLKKINEDFRTNWPRMTDEEKIRWKYQRYMQDYLATISSLDDNVGRLLDYLDATGLSENTLVMYTSDNGFYLGENGWFDKRFAYRESFHVPLLVRWPAKVPAGNVSDELVQNLDFAPTILNAAGAEVPGDMQGLSLLEILQNPESELGRDAVYYHYYEYPAVHMVKRHYAMATKDYKLIHFYHDVDEWELYDLKRDPSEQHNVIDRPEYAEELKRLRARLERLRAQVGDSTELDRHFIELTGDADAPDWFRQVDDSVEAKRKR